MAGSADADLVEQVLGAGNARAYAVLISRHYEAAYRQACRLVGDPIEAQDLVQEAFLKAHLELSTLRDPARYGAWLHHIVHSTCMDWHRQLRFQLHRSSQASASSFPIEDLTGPQAPTPLDVLRRSELMAQLREAAAGLARRYRQSVVLHYLDQLGCEEMASQLGVPLNTALSLLHRARSQIRQTLNGYVQETPDCTTITLDPNTLPSRQGWRYRTGYEFLPGGPAEARVCQARNGVLTIDDADLYPDNFAFYSLHGVVDPYRPFVLRFRARKQRETARYPEYQVDDDPRRPRNRSFVIRVLTGRESYALEIGARQLRLNRDLVTTAIDNRRFHDYRLEGTPGVGRRLFVDGTAVGSALPERLCQRNQISFGALSPASGNFRAEIAELAFTQMRPGTLVPRVADRDGAADLLDFRPFAALGSTDADGSCHPAWYKLRSAQQLQQVVRRYSRKWQLRPTDPIVPVDFAPR